MWFRSQLDSLKARGSVKPARRQNRRPIRRAAYRPRLEALEDRRLLSFSLGGDFVPGGEVNDIVIADLNRDGRPDLATVDYRGDNASVLLGDGTGALAPAQHFPLNSYGWRASVAVADLTGDAVPDLVTANGTDRLSLLAGNGDGSFQGPRIVSVPPPPAAPYGYSSYYTIAFTVADVNADGKSDLLLQCGYLSSDDYGTYLSVLLGTGDGSFAAAASYPLDLLAAAAASFAIGGLQRPKVVAEDLNADGNLDLAVGGGRDATWEVGAGGIAILLGAGNGTFSAPQYYPYPDGGSTLAVADLNGDGNPDLATQGLSSVEVLAGNGDGSFGPPRSYPVGSAVTSLATADVNQDGRPDMITGVAGYVSVLLADAAGGFHSPIVHAAGPDSAYPDVVATGDFNGDARPDVGVASHLFFVSPQDTVINVRVLLNDGAWTPPPPRISISDVTVTEGNTGTRPATFTVRLFGAGAAPVTVTFATADGTATAGSDYQATSGTLTFAPGETEKTITVPVYGDRLGEPNETFVVNLSRPTNATIADGQGVGTIVDDEPRIRISNVSTLEGQAGQTTLFTFTVTLSAAYDQPVTMSFRTVNGTAKANRGDYVAQTGTLTFAPGETTKTITIEVVGDNRREALETFYLDLSGNSSNSLFAKNRGLGTILNDD